MQFFDVSNGDTSYMFLFFSWQKPFIEPVTQMKQQMFDGSFMKAKIKCKIKIMLNRNHKN